MKTRVLPLLFLSAGLLVSCSAERPDSGANGGTSASAAQAAKLTPSDDRVRIELGGQLFTEYIFKGAPKPYFYPVLASDGTEMMRHFPMKKDVPGEVMDHPHHRSLWFTHGAVNGVDFWAESQLNKPGQTRQGQIVNESVEHSVKDGVAEIRSNNKWVGPDGTVHLTDETVIRARQLADGSRLLDYEVTLKAPKERPVVFGDTKEGSMAIRVPLWMTPAHSYNEVVQGKDGKTTRKRIQHEGKGSIVNAEGIRDKPTWGKRSTWVDYHAPKDGKVYGIAMFDHPKNPRHPTWWHVRDYALFAANPFGEHDFESTPEKKVPAGTGDFKIPAGGSATFRWRLYFHEGDEKAGKVAQRYNEYAAGK